MKKTRFLFSLLMAIVMMAMSPQRMWAIGGSGTSISPYTIASADDLKEFADIVNGTNGKTRNVAACGKLTADINLGNAAWKAMGSSSYAYTGTFDGQGHKISGLSLTATADNAGFFGYVNGATIKNFTLDGTISSNSNNVGSVAGHSKGNTQILDVVSSVNITMSAAKQHLGGIVGYLCDATGDTPVIKGCTYSGTMDVAGSTDSNGGIVGYGLKNANISITNCFFSGTIKTTGSNARVGGILGYADDDGSNFVALSGCFVNGSFSTGSGTDNVGAIAGMPRGNTYNVIKNNNCLSGIATHILGNNFERDGKCDASNKAITISVTANANGTVSQTYVNPTTSAATQLQVVATPNAHYHFRSWSDSGAQTHNVSLTENVSLSASFAIDQHTISVATNNSTMGTVSGGGTYNYGSQQTIKATPKEHYHFVEWNDGDKNATRTISVTENKTYTATFAPNQFTITVKTNDGNMGTVSGGGKYDYNTQQTITATPKAHYHFVQWNDGITDASRTITVNGNATYTATFAIDQHEITVTGIPAGWGTYNGSGTYDYGTNITITATAKDGYLFRQWTDGDTNHSREITVTEDQTYTARFSRIEAKAILLDGTLTFYYDGIDHDGDTYDVNARVWVTNSTIRSSITHIVFDESFAAVHCENCHFFTQLTNLQSITGLEYLNTDAVTDMYRMFWNCSSLTSLDLSHFNTANVTDMANMFENCSSLQTVDLSSFNTEKVTNMYQMFENCSSLQSLDLSSFNTKGVTKMGRMFYNCSSLQSLDLSNFNTEHVTSMDWMFYGCRNLQSLVLSNFNTEQVTNMYQMFDGCSSLQSLDLGNFDMQFVTNTTNMFNKCTSLKTLTLKSLPFLKQGTFDTQFSGDGKTVNVILDDNSAIYTDGTNYLPTATSATFNREIVADGGMYSFIVPFDIPAGQAAELGKFYQYTSHDPEVRKVYFDDIAEVSDGVVKANTAYFFKPAKDITSFTVNNPSIPRTLTIPDPEYPSVPGLYGTYSEIAVPEGAYGYAMLDGQSTFVKAGYGNALWPFRAYLWLGSGAYMAKALAFFGDYDDITGINNIETDTDLDMSKPIYTLSGQRIMTPKKGEIFIQNGKKVIKK